MLIFVIRTKYMKAKDIEIIKNNKGTVYYQGGLIMIDYK